MKIETIEVSGFASALTGLRKPFKGKIKSEVKHLAPVVGSGKHHDAIFDYGTLIKITTEDLQLMQKLIKAGDEHAKCIRGIRVTADITAPRYFWSEHDTYRIGVDSLCSESTMHTILKDELSEDNFEEGTYIHTINGFCEYVKNVKALIARGKLTNTEATRTIKKNIPEGFLQTRTIQYSYQALRRIYFQRRNHRLPEWSKTFVDWIKTLPLANELILIEK